MTKRVRITRGASVVNKDIVYAFDGEGKLASTRYPDESKPFVISYDAMGRPSGMTQEYQPPGLEVWQNRGWADATYGVAGELLTFSSFAGEFNGVGSTLTETRTYNSRFQMTKQRTMMGSTVAMDLEYEFTNGSSPNNDGRILARRNLKSMYGVRSATART